MKHFKKYNIVIIASVVIAITLIGTVAVAASTGTAIPFLSITNPAIPLSITGCANPCLTGQVKLTCDPNILTPIVVDPYTQGYTNTIQFVTSSGSPVSGLYVAIFTQTNVGGMAGPVSIVASGTTNAQGSITFILPTTPFATYILGYYSTQYDGQGILQANAGSQTITVQPTTTVCGGQTVSLAGNSLVICSVQVAGLCQTSVYLHADGTFQASLPLNRGPYTITMQYCNWSGCYWDFPAKIYITSGVTYLYLYIQTP